MDDNTRNLRRERLLKNLRHPENSGVLTDLADYAIDLEDRLETLEERFDRLMEHKPWRKRVY